MKDARERLCIQRGAWFKMWPPPDSPAVERSVRRFKIVWGGVIVFGIVDMLLLFWMGLSD